MRVVNKLTEPGGIRRVDLTPDTICIQTSDGQDRVYRLVSEYTAGKDVPDKGAERNDDNLPVRS